MGILRCSTGSPAKSLWPSALCPPITTKYLSACVITRSHYLTLAAESWTKNISWTLHQVEYLHNTEGQDIIYIPATHGCRSEQNKQPLITDSHLPPFPVCTLRLAQLVRPTTWPGASPPPQTPPVQSPTINNRFFYNFLYFIFIHRIRYRGYEIICKNRNDQLSRLGTSFFIWIKGLGHYIEFKYTDENVYLYIYCSKYCRNL